MSELVTVSGNTRKEKYESIIPQIKSLLENERDSIANLSNIASVLKYGMGFFWVGFYRVMENELILGPFQGTVACTRIGYGKGVCGTSWKEKKTIIVKDVNDFPGHIACSSHSKSEIVIPLFDLKGNVIQVMDIDSDKPLDFDETDKSYLEQVVSLIGENLHFQTV